ncbi:NACHT domain- and WD repeat-containing protein 1-like isoform x1 [Plakobranchus ocellatus]|uniref:NACHT domain- and WD repeat-containing protein 1-like isoform x1 n=1 Tax=Plakobranchus ocellatus TaxID=259542 RepID=A0AAV4AI13_9GAST|nr:NACHT domain- and WD repeat-containing protein 1-like isoform x1 [Plakobranchus ocellatus]
MNNIIATPDGKRCLTYNNENLSISSHTVALWDIEKGTLIASHTFSAGVTCAHLTPDGKLAALGVRGEYQPIRLILVAEGSTLEQTTQAWIDEVRKEKDNDSAGKGKTFGDPQRLDAVINLVTD